MMVQRYVALAFEKDAVPKADDIPVLKPYLTVEPAQQAETLKKFEKQTALLGERPIIGFCPGAEFGPAKRWPHYHYAKLAEMLIEKGYAVELFGYTPPLSDKAVIIRLIEGDLIKVRKSTDSSEGYHQSLIDIKPEKVAEKLTALLDV